MAQSLYRQASLIMNPYGAKDTLLPSIKPTDGSGDFTFSRDGAGASPATRVNASGLIEKGRTNELAYSNTFSNAVWDKLGVTLTTGQADPFGGNNATKVDFAGGVSAYLAQGNLGSTNVRTRSIWMRADSNIEVSFSDGVTANAINITTSWVRYEAFISTIPASGLQIDNYFSLTTPLQAISVYVYAAQVEDGLVATDYIETTTAPVSAGLLGDMPRLDYSGGATCPSLLLEPSRVNLFSQSEYLSSSFWFDDDITRVQNTSETLSPEGVYNAVKLTETATSARHRLASNTLTISNDTYTASVFLKRGTARYGFVHLSGANAYTIVVDLEEGVITDTATNSTIVHQSVEDYGNGWYRCSVAGNMASVTTAYIVQFGTAGSAEPTYSNYVPTFLGSTSNNIYAFGAGMELGSYPTSYIPTYGSASTRGADASEITGASAIIGQTEGTIFYEFKSPISAPTANQFLSITDGTNTNRILFGPSAAGDTIRVVVIFSGTSNGGDNYSVTDLTSTNKIAVKYSSSSVEVFINGVKQTSQSGGVFNNSLSVITNESGANSLYVDMKQTLAFPTALTDAECIALTTI